MPMPRVLGGSQGFGRFPMGEVPLKGLGVRVADLGFRVRGSGFGVSGVGFGG